MTCKLTTNRSAPFGLPFGAFFVRAHQGRGLRAAALFSCAGSLRSRRSPPPPPRGRGAEGRKISTTRNHAEPSGTALSVIHIGCA